jgi:hypothetical protein
MGRYKVVDRNPRLLPVVLSEQIQPGTLALCRSVWNLTAHPMLCQAL